MTEQIPSPNDTKAYTALAIQVYSGAFFGENLSRCVSDKEEDAYYHQVLDMAFDYNKVDYFQRELLKGDKNPYTLLGAAISIQNFKEANDMLDVLFAQNPSTEQLLDALDLEHSGTMLRNILFKKGRPYPNQEFRRKQGYLLVDRLRAALPRKEFITKVMKQPYSHEMSMEDLEFERDKIRIQQLEKDRATTHMNTLPYESTEGTQSPVQHIITAPILTQGDFSKLLFRER